MSAPRIDLRAGAIQFRQALLEDRVALARALDRLGIALAEVCAQAIERRRGHRFGQQLRHRIARREPLRQRRVRRFARARQVAHHVDAAFHDRRNQRIVHHHVANQMREAVDAGIHQIDRIDVIEDVRVDLQAALVGLIDDRAIQRRAAASARGRCDRRPRS